MKGKIRNIYLIITATIGMTIILSSCHNNVVWTDTESIPESGWTPDQPVTFNLDPKAYEPEENRFVKMTAKAVGDTMPRLKGDFHAKVSLRYKDDCNASDLGIVMEKVSLDSEISTDTLHFQLFAPDGISAGRGRFGLNEVSIHLPFPFTVSEGTTITLTPLHYPQPVTDLLSITLTLNNLTENSSD